MAHRGPVFLMLIAAAGCAALLDGCAAPPHSPAAAPQPTGSILMSSSPAAGSTVQGPVNELDLHFNPPARLDEITVNGPDGLMPVKVTAVGEIADYSIPLSGLGTGKYAVNWKAASAGRNYQGSFAFTVK
jgi:methionine-rich copper-binding protein CopC